MCQKLHFGCGKENTQLRTKFLFLVLIYLFLELDIKYCDLGLPNRDAANDIRPTLQMFSFHKIIFFGQITLDRVIWVSFHTYVARFVLHKVYLFGLVCFDILLKEKSACQE